MKLKLLVTILFAASILTCLHLPLLQAQIPKYAAFLLPTIPKGSSFTAMDLNNIGEVVGYYTIVGPQQQQRAFLYTNGTMIDLGTLGGSQSQANAINDASQVVGYANTATNIERAFLYSNGTMSDLGTLPRAIGNQGSAALAINTAGQAVGQSTSSASGPGQGGGHSVIFWQGNVIDIGSLSGHKQDNMAISINDVYNATSSPYGQVVGISYSNVTNHFDVFLYADNVITDITSTLCPDFSFNLPNSINNAGQILGSCSDSAYPGPYLPFLYNIKDGNYSFIANPSDSPIFDLNDAGQVVGMTGNATLQFPFLFMDEVIYNLYDLIYSNSTLLDGLEPIAINNKGQIVANTYLGVVLLTPAF